MAADTENWRRAREYEFIGLRTTGNYPMDDENPVSLAIVEQAECRMVF
jgi:hypothetical protein